jgi:hypothetical protein
VYKVGHARIDRLAPLQANGHPRPRDAATQCAVNTNNNLLRKPFAHAHNDALNSSSTEQCTSFLRILKSSKNMCKHATSLHLMNLNTITDILTLVLGLSWNTSRRLRRPQIYRTNSPRHNAKTMKTLYIFLALAFSGFFSLEVKADPQQSWVHADLYYEAIKDLKRGDNNKALDDLLKFQSANQESLQASNYLSLFLAQKISSVIARLKTPKITGSFTAVNGLVNSSPSPSRMLDACNDAWLSLPSPLP